jgi:hypothetical protein
MASRMALELRQKEHPQKEHPKSRFDNRRLSTPKSPQTKREEATVAKLLTHLDSLKSKGVITQEDEREILRNYYSLERQRQELASHEGEVVVVSNGELFFGQNLNDAMKEARENQGERPVYSETIDMTDYPSPLG